MLRSKNLTIVLSLLIAILLWSYVIAFENPPTTERIKGVPVELMNERALNQNGFAILEGDNVTVEVVVSGTRAEIARYRDQIIATVDVFGFSAGESYPTVVVRPPGNLTSVEVRPSKIFVSIEDLVSAHKPVIIGFTGEISKNTEPGSITCQPEQIEVTGPKSLVEAVSYVGIEVPYSRLRRQETEITARAFALDINGEPVSKVRLSSETVSVISTLYSVKRVPLNLEIIGTVNEKYEVTQLDIPDTIAIRGSREDIEGIESVYAEPIDISEVEITSELPVTPILPQGIEVANSSYGIHVSIGLKGISSKRFEYDFKEIEIRGTGKGLKAYINSPTVVLRAAGIEAVLDAAANEDFTLYVDIEGLEEGSHVVRVVVEHDIPLVNLEIVPEEIHITVSEDL